MTVSAELKADLAAVFERYAAETGDAALKRVAAALRFRQACKRGPKFKDDEASLAKMAGLVEMGLAVWTAAALVAKEGCAGNSVESSTRRLSDKFNKRNPKLRPSDRPD